MVKLRLRRMGRKSRPVYDIVAADSRYPRDGRFIEKVGQYNPLTPEVQLKRDRVIHWMSTGAQPTDTVRSLLRREGVLLELSLRKRGTATEEIAQHISSHQAKHALKPVVAPKPKPVPPTPVAVEEAPVAETPVAVEEAPAAETPVAVEEAPVAEEAPAATEEAPAAADEAAPAAEEN